MGRYLGKTMFRVVLIFAVVCLFNASLVQAVSACGEQTVEYLYSGKSIRIGTVTAYNDDINLYIILATRGDWRFTGTQVAVAANLSDIPQTSTGNPKIGLFPYKSEDRLSAEHAFIINLADSGYTTGTGLFIAARAEAVLDHEGKIIRNEDAWAEGSEFPARNRASYFMHTIQPCSEDWVITFTNRGVLLPVDAITFICDTARPEIVSWVQREADKYGQQTPFTGIRCLEDQILLTGDIVNYPGAPLNDAAAISFLENTVQTVKNAEFVTIIHYLDLYDNPFYQHDYDSKYDFFFFKKWPPLPYPFLYPALSTDAEGETLIHELMHKLGATDKYYHGPEQACQINPETGQEYNGYDIMCHRISDGTGGYITPPLSKLIISEPTAAEIGWLLY